MTTTSNVSGTGSSTTSSSVNQALSSSSASASDLQSQFLTMLVTQMNNQDPLNPMDNSQLTSQLAQISTVSSLQTMNTTLNQLLSQNSASQAMNSASLIGRSVEVPGSQISVAGGTPSKFGVDLPTAADTASVTIKDSGGNVVRTLTLSNKAAGVQDVSWDGKDNNGNTVADGNYTFSVSATAKGNSVSPVALNYATVQSITGDSSGVLVGLTNGQSANVNDIRRIS